MKKVNKLHFSLGKDISVGRLALLLVLTKSRQEEELVKEQILQFNNIKFAVTGLGGMVDEIPGKIVQTIVGAALNSNIIKNNTPQVHALIHAAQEGFYGMMLEQTIKASYVMKISIVTDGVWIAVALYGQAAFHPMTNHERSGLGIMHLGDLLANN